MQIDPIQHELQSIEREVVDDRLAEEGGEEGGASGHAADDAGEGDR